MRNRLRVCLLMLILGAAPSALKAQTFTWQGDGGTNQVPTAGNWTGTGTFDLNNTGTTLIFADTGSYAPTPYLPSGSYQIGTLGITNAGYGNIFAGNGTGAISTTINGLNVATAITFSPSSASSSTPATPMQITGPLFLNGSNVTIGGNAPSGNALSIGRASAGNGGGASVVTSGGAAITKSGAFELEIGGNAAGLGQINLTGGSVFLDPTASGFQSNVVTSSNTTFGFHPNTNATYTYSGVISGPGGITMNGNSGSTTELTSQNLYGGLTNINNGTLRLATNGALLNSAFVYINAGATLDVAANQTINNFTGSTSPSSSIIIQNGKKLTINPVTTGFTNTAYSGTISGLGSLEINGTGSFLSGTGSKVKISGNNTYQGGTTINGGALEVTNATGSGLGTGPVTVNSGGALLGDTGRITGALTINSGGTFGVVTSFNAGAMTINGGATYFWGLANAGTGAAPAVGGTDYGLLVMSGALALSATAGNPITLKVATFSTGGSNPVMGAASNFDVTQSYSWNLTSGASNLTGFSTSYFTVDTSLITGGVSGTFAVTSSGNNLVLNYTGAPIPEPSAFAAIAGLFVLSGAALRRKIRRR